MAQTEAIRSFLPALLDELGCQTLLDIPCGDFHWMRTVRLGAQYTGADIVERIIEENEERYGGPNRRFVRLDLLRDPLPKSDLVLCRDCLVHLSNADIFAALENMRLSGSKYLLTTTFEDRAANVDIRTGDWRPLNLRLAPFHFSPPLKLLDERCPWENYRDKHIGLWLIADLPAISEFRG